MKLNDHHRVYPKLKLRSLLLSCVLVFQTGATATAQSTEPDLAAFAKSLPQDVLRRIAQRPNRYLQEMSQLLFQLSSDGVATPAAVTIFNNRQTANFRSRQIVQLLKHDLDGDGNLTAEEIALQLPFIQPQERGQLTLKVLEADEDSDQGLSFSEILAASQASAAERSQRNNGFNIDAVMAFDANADGQVDLPEIASVIAVLDPADLEAAVRQPRNQRQATSNCEAPKPADGSEVVFLSGYEGTAVSTLAVSGQDRETSVATIIIEDGTTPLYVFATALDSIVWAFSGATDRVQKLVVQPGNTNTGPGAAVAGIPGDKITFIEPQSCVASNITQQNAQASAQMGRLSTHLGQPIAHTAISYYLEGVQLPKPTNVTTEVTEQATGYGSSDDQLRRYRTPTTFSIGEHDYELSARGMTRVGSDATTIELGQSSLSPIRSMMRFHPAGLIHFSPDEVHASAKVEPYVVLPQQAGLLQLIADGSVEFQSDGTYYIKEPIARFPAGLHGGHLVKFVLGTGVALPAGSPGHSSVVSEETGECLTGARCR